MDDISYGRRENIPNREPFIDYFKSFGRAVNLTTTFFHRKKSKLYPAQMNPCIHREMLEPPDHRQIGLGCLRKLVASRG